MLHPLWTIVINEVMRPHEGVAIFHLVIDELAHYLVSSIEYSIVDTEEICGDI